MAEIISKTKEDFIKELTEIVGEDAIEGWMSTENEAFGNLIPNRMFETGNAEPLWNMLDELKSDIQKKMIDQSLKDMSTDSVLNEKPIDNTEQPVPNTEHVKKTKVDSSSYEPCFKNTSQDIPQIDIFDKIDAFFKAVIAVLLFVSLMVLVTVLTLISVNEIFNTNISINGRTIVATMFLMLTFFLITRQSN